MKTGQTCLWSGVAWVLGVCLLLAGSHACAGGQNISGKKLLLKSKSGKEKIVLLSKDGLVNAGANGGSADPRCLPDGSGWGGAVALDGGTNTAVLSMGCGDSTAGWTTNGAGSRYKFKNSVFSLAPK